MHRLAGVPRDYSWGSREAIPRLLGQAPGPQPLAELWFGAHPSAPALVVDDDGGTDLRSLIAADPEGSLGFDVVHRFGTSLPYLLKLIAPDAPLSLQVHPSLGRARAGFSYEEAIGIPIDSRERSYKDPNHKPELIYALTRFQAMAGFRAPRRAAELLAGLDVPLARRLHGLLHADTTATGVRTAFRYLLEESSRPRGEEVEELAAACKRRLRDGSPSPRADRTVVLLAEHYPHDVGVVASILLNPVTLNPGDALFVPAGAVHAYLSGVGVEIMASSDNVLRAGLTSKHIDVGELLDNVDYVAAPPIRVAPERFHRATRVYYAPVDDFELSVTELVDRSVAHPLPGRGPRILLCLDGFAEVRSSADVLELRHGQAAFIRADEGSLEARGSGVIFQADVP